jgi:hypothetical protein
MFGEMRGLAVGLGIFWILVFITNNDVIRGVWMRDMSIWLELPVTLR